MLYAMVIITGASLLYLVTTIRVSRNSGEETEPICMDDCSVKDCLCKKARG